MKDFFIKYKWHILLASLVCLVLIPFAIHCAFYFPAVSPFWNPDWEGGDVLSFYGSILAALVGVWGVHLSIDYAKSNYQQDIKDQVKPFIVFSQLRVQNQYNVFLHGGEDLPVDEDDIPFYTERKNDNLAIIIRAGEIKYQQALSKSQKELVLRDGHYIQEENGVEIVRMAKLAYSPLHIENVGKGAAILVMVGLNLTSGAEKEYQYAILGHMACGETVHLQIFCSEVDDIKNQGSYHLDFVYEDIYGTRFRQRHVLELSETGSKILLDGKQTTICS